MNQDIEIKATPRQTIEVFDPIPLMDTGRFEQMQRLASIMARSPLIPECLRTTPAIDEQGFPVKHNGRNVIDRLPYEAVLANCFLIINQSVRWGMDPFAVAACVSVVRGRLCYEGKLVAGVLDAKLGIELDYQWDSEKGDAFGITVSGRTTKRGELKVVYGTVGDWKTTGESSPWAKPGNHRRMLAYRGAREWARIHKPSLMLGVYTDDEMEVLEARRSITPVQNALGRPQDKLEAWEKDIKDHPPQRIAGSQPATTADDPAVAEFVDGMREMEAVTGVSEKLHAIAAKGTHGSPELDADAAKLAAMGQDPGPTLEEAGLVDENPTTIEPTQSNGESPTTSNTQDGPPGAAREVSMAPPEPTDAAGYEAYCVAWVSLCENRQDCLVEWNSQRKLRNKLQVDMDTVARCKDLIAKTFPKEG